MLPVGDKEVRKTFLYLGYMLKNITSKTLEPRLLVSFCCYNKRPPVAENNTDVLSYSPGGQKPEMGLAATMTCQRGWVPGLLQLPEAARIPQLAAPSSSFKAATSGQVFPLLLLWFSLLISNSTLRDP